jgi:hypothetical protein
VNVATRATDLDTKDVKIESERGAYAQSFLLTLKNRNWMKESGFPSFLNKMGHTRAKYGGVLVKKTEHDGELDLHVLRWRDLVTDQVHILSSPIIERHYYTPAELREKDGDGWENIDEAIETAKKLKESTAAADSGKENKTPGSYIEVFEVHGVLPKSYLNDKYGTEEAPYGTETGYERQMHIVVIDESTAKKGEETKGVRLFSGRETECPYKYLPWEEVDGRGLGVGVVEDLFEAQVWTNDSVKKKKDILELAGKIIWQTSDQSIAAKNVLTDIENGTILQHRHQSAHHAGQQFSLILAIVRQAHRRMESAGRARLNHTPSHNGRNDAIRPAVPPRCALEPRSRIKCSPMIISWSSS